MISAQKYYIILSLECHHFDEVKNMAVSYKKLWKLLIDKDMLKKDLQAAADISSGAIAKLGRNENVTTAVLMKICNALGCDIGDIMEIIPDQPKEAKK